MALKIDKNQNLSLVKRVNKLLESRPENDKVMKHLIKYNQSVINEI